MKEYLVTVDIGKRRDYTGIMITKDNAHITDGVPRMKIPDRVLHTYDIVYIDKMQKIPYPEQVSRVQRLMESYELRHNCELIVDATGVGEAVIDIMRHRRMMPVPVLMTGGTAAREVYADASTIFTGPAALKGMRTLLEIHVPKKDMVDSGVLLLNQNRIRVAGKLRWAEDFKKQLMAFKETASRKSSRSLYEAEHEFDHDDLVIAYLLMSWWVTHKSQEIEERVLVTDDGGDVDWSPYDFM